MEYATRLASEDVACRYPLGIDGRADWQQKHGTPAVWVQEFLLPDIPANHIIVPSFAQQLGEPQFPTAAYAFQFSLHTSTDVFILQPVPAQAAEHAGSKTVPDADVSCHIDCWHTHKTVPAPRIRLAVSSAAKPDRYLLTLSVRPIESPCPARADGPHIELEVPARISQLQADANIRNRICSPTALTMALSPFANAPDWPGTVEACYDPLTRAYGSWPLAIQWASRYGIIGAVEALSSWHDAVRVLQAGTPMVCSIRFAKGKLHDAPLEQTGGHLVMVYGLHGDHVLARDPAAATNEEVERRYRMDEFGEAWLKRRGATYIFCNTLRSKE